MFYKMDTRSAARTHTNLQGQSLYPNGLFYSSCGVMVCKILGTHNWALLPPIVRLVHVRPIPCLLFRAGPVLSLLSSSFYLSVSFALWRSRSCSRSRSRTRSSSRFHARSRCGVGYGCFAAWPASSKMHPSHGEMA